MRTTIQDQCPGASPGRQQYLERRIEKIFGPQSSRVQEVRLGMQVVDVPNDDPRQEVEIRWTWTDGREDRVCAQRRTLPVALAAAFEASEDKLKHTAPAAGARAS